MVRTAGFQERLVDPSTTSDNTHRRTSTACDRLLGPTREANTGFTIIRGMANDSCVISRRACEGTAIANLFFEIADDGTFGALSDGENVADGEGGFFAAVDEGTGV